MADVVAKQAPALALADVERQYVDWLSSPSASSGKDSFHAIHDGEEAPLCYLGGCDVRASALVEAGITHILSLVSPRRGQRPAASSEGDHGGAPFDRLVIEIEDDFDADLPSVLPQALAFLDQAAAGGDRKRCCLVHCELGRSRSASVVIAWLLQRRARRGQRASLLECWAAVARTRRISALNLGFFARLCDLEHQLCRGEHAPSMTLLDYARLPLLDRAQFAFKPVPSAGELVAESCKDENAPEATARERAIRRLMRNLLFVLRELRAESPACAAALEELNRPDDGMGESETAVPRWMALLRG